METGRNSMSAIAVKTLVRQIYEGLKAASMRAMREVERVKQRWKRKTRQKTDGELLFWKLGPGLIDKAARIA